MINKIIMPAALIFLLVTVCSSQWQTDVRLTSSTGSSLTNIGRSMVSENDYLHICWIDNRDGNFEVYYKRSTNAGLTWSADHRLTNNSAYTYAACISAEGVNIHITFSDDRTGKYEIYYMKSTNKGLNWSGEIRLSSADEYHSYESDICANGNLYVAWLEERTGDLDIYFTRSTNDGSSWSSPVRLTPNTYAQKYPVLSVSGSNIHVVYQDERAGISNVEVYYMRSTNSGLNWQSEINISEHSGLSYNGYVFASGSTVHIVWDDNRSGDREVYYRRSTNNGANWSGDAIITVEPGISAGPSIKASGNYAHMIWSDERDGNREIYYKISTNNGSSWSGDLRLTNNPGYSGAASLCLAGNVVNVLWYDDRNGNNEIYYKRNPTGNPSGISAISSEVPDKFSLSQNYPNPFNPVTNIEFSILHSGLTKLVIYDVLGREMETLVSSELNPGTYKAEWDASKYNSNSGWFYRNKEDDPC